MQKRSSQQNSSSDDSSSGVIIGPYEFINNKTSHKITLAIMQNYQISQRLYNAQGNVMENKKLTCKDLTDAIKVMEKQVSELKGYKEKTAGSTSTNTSTSSKVSDSSASSQSDSSSSRSSSSVKQLGKRSRKQQEPDEETKDEVKSKSKTQSRRDGKYESKKKQETSSSSTGEVKVTGSGCIEVMLAQSYDPEKHDPTGWLMSEKLDGVRCYWNGQTMYTRNGKLFYPPDDFKAQLPPIAIDGELWTNRDDFQKIVSIVRKQDKNSEAWKQIKFMVFDAPLVKGTFQQRIDKVKEYITKDGVVQLVHQVKCKSKEHMEKEMDIICGGKGEGIMIKDPKSKYDRKRSYSLLKVKRFEDSEATVVGHQKGTGRCTGMLGALECVDDNGIEFKIGSGFDDSQRSKPPKIGSRVTYKFQGRSNAGKPRFPIFLRVHPGI